MGKLLPGIKKARKNGSRFLLLAVATCFMFTFLLVSGCSQVPAPIQDDKEPAAEGKAEEVQADEFIILATTTSTYDSGLLDVLLPAFTEKYGIKVHVLSKGTGQALEIGKRGDADVLLVHDRPTELKLVEEGYFTDRRDVMYNDFIVVGPPADPVGVKEINKVTEAFAAIASRGYTFLSRGDDSGTNRVERSLWEEAGVSDFGDWYLSVGQGMGDTLRMASEMQAYTLADRATYLSLKDKLDLEILLEGDPILFNQYGIMVLNPARHPYVKYESALKLIEFMLSPEGQQIIASFQIGGESLFFPGKVVED